MKFKTDENLPGEIALLLQQAGHDALTLAEQSMLGSTDPTIASVCRAEGRAIVTLDVADIRTYPPKEYSGIVVLRLSRQDKPHVLRVFQQTLPKFETERSNS
jgi:predicted nuclease of predicted toxin-antitoxin system